MGKWERIYVSEANIKARTDRAVLIACPRLSELCGFQFWHSAKLVREECGRFSVSFTDDFTFRIKMYENRTVIEEKQVGAKEIKEAFNRKDIMPLEEYVPLIYTPPKLEPEHAQALKELIDCE